MVNRTAGVVRPSGIDVGGTFRKSKVTSRVSKSPTKIPAPPTVSKILEKPKTEGLPSTAESVEIAKTREVGGAIGGVAALAGIINAFSEYSQIKSRSKLNIQLASQQAGEIRALGKEAALREETKGFERGEEALLSAAAQGQAVRGPLAQSLQLEEELFGVFSAMQVEVNAIREAFGHEIEASIFESDIRQAKINRDSAIFNSILQGSVSVLSFV